MKAFISCRSLWPYLPKKGHLCVFGSTGCGKTWALVALAIQAGERRPNPTTVLAYIPDPADAERFKQYCPGDVFIFRCVDAFLQALKHSRNCIGIWDEVTSTFDAKKLLHKEVPTYSRHWGHQMIFVGHRYTSFSTLIRSSCTTVILFRVDRSSARMAAGDYASSELEKAPLTQRAGEFVELTSCEDTVYGRVF